MEDGAQREGPDRPNCSQGCQEGLHGARLPPLGRAGSPSASLTKWRGPSWPVLGRGLSLAVPEREAGHCPRLPPACVPAMCAGASVGLPGPPYGELSGIWGRKAWPEGRWGAIRPPVLGPTSVSFHKTGGELAEPGGGRAALIDFVGQESPPPESFQRSSVSSHPHHFPELVKWGSLARA